jgi:cytochrome c biogenesis protein CcmG, thiol:disulfide interchange protein DsbE
MTRFAAALIAGLVAILGAQNAATASTHFRVGQPAPHFAVDSLDGGKITSDKFQGRAVFLNFFATWCRPCKLELPYITKQYAQSSSGIVFVGVDEDESATAVAAFDRLMGITYTVGIDQGNVAAEFLIEVIPTSVFIDRHGIVRAINRGYLTAERLEQDLSLISGH